jgi:glycosyltransferase 2 family protein
MRYLLIGFAAVTVLSCLYALRSDLGAMSLTPLAHSWDVVLLAVLCSLMNYGLRILRWQRYLERLGYSAPLAFSSLSYVAGFAFTVSPGKVGEMMRARYFARLGISVTEVAGAFCVERLMDVLAMLALATLMVVGLPHYRTLAWSAAGLLAAALLLLRLLPWRALVDSLARVPRLPEVLLRLARSVDQVTTAARSLLQPSMLLLGLAVGIVAWGLEGVGLDLLSSIVPSGHLAMGVAVGIYAVAVLAGALSFLPGGLGGTEAVMTILLTAHGYTFADALLITLVCRLVTLWLAVAMGWTAVWVLRAQSVASVTPWP